MSLETLPRHEYHPSDQAALRAIGGVVTRAEQLQSQIDAEATYHNAMVVHPADSQATLSSQEIIDRMEVDHVVKHAPHLDEQLSDISRTAIIERVGTIPGWPTRVTEHDALVDIDEYLRAAEMAFAPDDIEYQRAQDIRQNLTFIGESEYHEAVSGIAMYWKQLLESNPHQQIFVPAGMIARAETSGAGFAVASVKSDDYLFDSILQEFSDDELQRYAGRLIAREDDITVASADDLKVVFLDDWTISGRQLDDAATDFIASYPQFTSSIEVQLITTSEERLKTGLTGDFFGKDGASDRASLPIRSYYLAHESSMADTASGARVTGAHSSVDFDFQVDLVRIATEAGMTAAEEVTDSSRLAVLKRTSKPPLLTYIDRPYRKSGVVLHQKERLQDIRRQQMVVA